MTKLNKETFIEALKQMTLLEIKELVDGIQQEFGFDLSSVVATSGNKNESNNEQVEQTKFSVIMKNFGEDSSKIPVIKEVRDITHLGLIDAKKLTETPNAVIKENVDKIEAENIKAKLEKLGAQIELK
ncbi:50S ribosomal protein L7/L12 ['Camptotheca acuminata' phytoplasma]|uniref:50S ribosomal protein L7/L12 n=1 Tax='Camptotheca acuminata' phytoplasma TaxID=3239192 RepID=UPI00351A3765